MNIFSGISQLYARAVTLRDAVHETLRPGSTGPDVMVMLGLMRQLGYTNVNGDVYGPEQESQVKAFQEDYLLVPDGIVGRQTWAALDTLVATEYRQRPPVQVRPEIARINSLFRLWSSLGYYSSTAENDAGYQIGKASAAQRAIAAAAGRKATHGQTCGHFGDYLAKLYLGQADPRIRHTGMNLACYWRHRDNAVIARRSSVGVGLLSGHRIVDAGGWKPHVCGCFPAVSTEHVGAELSVIEYGSHIICRLRVDAGSGIIDPRTGMLARPGVYRVGADGTKAMPGMPHTFRLWRESDDAGVRNVFGVDQTRCTNEPFVATLGV